MTNAQKLALRASEVRTRLAELGALDTLTDEQRSEIGTLRDEYRDIETRAQALTIAGDGDDPDARGDGIETREDAELADLERRSDVGDLFHRLVAGSASAGDPGPLRELQKHHGLGDDQIPVGVLRRSTLDDLETRAVTPAPADVGQNQAEIIPYVFPMSVSAFLAVDQPTVGVGEAVYPVLTKKLDVRTPAENDDAEETTGRFSADVLSPGRIQAAFFYSREDRARFAGMDSALRQNLSDGLADGLDAQIIAGTAGLLTGTNLANHDVTAQTTFANYLTNLAFGRVEGRYAGSAADVRVLMGATTYAHAGGEYRNNSVDRTALDRLMEVTGGVRVSAHVPAATAANAKARQNALVRLGMRRDMVAPVWEGVTIIPDEVTKAKQGQIVITAVMLYAVKILRADGFYKQQVQTLA